MNKLNEVIVASILSRALESTMQRLPLRTNAPDLAVEGDRRSRLAPNPAITRERKSMKLMVALRSGYFTVVAPPT